MSTNKITIKWVNEKWDGLVEDVVRSRVKSRDPLEIGMEVQVTYRSSSHRAVIVGIGDKKRKLSEDSDEDDVPLAVVKRLAAGPSTLPEAQLTGEPTGPASDLKAQPVPIDDPTGPTSDEAQPIPIDDPTGPTGDEAQPIPIDDPTGDEAQPIPIDDPTGPTSDEAQPIPIDDPTGDEAQPIPIDDPTGPTSDEAQPVPIDDPTDPTSDEAQPVPIDDPTSDEAQPVPIDDPTGDEAQPMPIDDPPSVPEAESTISQLQYDLIPDFDLSVITGVVPKTLDEQSTQTKELRGEMRDLQAEVKELRAEVRELRSDEKNASTRSTSERREPQYVIDDKQPNTVHIGLNTGHCDSPASKKHSVGCALRCSASVDSRHSKQPLAIREDLLGADDNKFGSLPSKDSVFLLVWANATVQFKFVSFYNSDHNDYDRGCCDDFFGGCDDFCDNYFFVCIDGDDTGPLGTSCDMAAITTAKLHEDNDNFNFPSTIPNLIANPYTMRVTSWSDSMQVFVRVWDLDTQNNDDEIDRARRTIYKEAARSLSTATWQQYRLGSRSQIDFIFEVRVYCDSYYHGSDCSVHCIPRDDQYGHYRCDALTGDKICYSGWKGSNCELDYDECQSNPCANGACVNGVDRFSCSCTIGWTGPTCDINVDDCASMPCKNGGTCHDHVANFTCACPLGEVYADEFCEYDDCAGQPCQNGATCNDLIGQFKCVCPLGYFGDLCEVDIDYCINQTCANNGTCVDRVGGFHCLCETGYEGLLCDVETDECSSNPCLHNGTCHDLIGKYQCACLEEYEGTHCDLETDECLSSPCRNNATCEDEFAGYHCHCVDGYEGDTCEMDIDECASFPCYINETCVDEINGFWCQRLNLCDNDPCLNNATCVDVYPGFICECVAGYGGKTCDQDIDECASSPCLRGTCTDHLDGYTCLCPPGYGGEKCHSETNECNSSPCLNGTCWDLINGYVCNCTAGYEGVLCQNEIDECASSPCLHQGTCTDYLNGYTCLCPPGYGGETCDQEDIDECASLPCLHQGTCTDHLDGYTCLCPPGYGGETCDQDIDECASLPCLHQGTCTDDLNGYTCLCVPGYDGETCDKDIDECASLPCLHQGTCTDHLDGYTCLCPPGYDGETCDKDIDECASSPCLHQGTCTDHLDGYTCLCPPGYGGETCHSETNECNSSPCLNGTCWDLINGYVCNCTAGYEGVLCQSEIDECASSPCEHGTCVDELNGYRCECDVFYEGTQCDTVIDEPCALPDPPCQNGICENTNSANDYNYKCTCDDGFYGTNCDIESKLYSAVVMVIGKLGDQSAFETKLANLLQKLYALQSRVRRDTGETVTVEIILTEDYVKSTDSSPLTRVTFLAWTESGYLQKDTMEAWIDGAPTDLPAQFGFDIYKGSAKPYTESWISSNWYIILLVVVTVALIVAVGFLFYHKGDLGRAKDAAIKYRGRDRAQSALETTFSTHKGEVDIAYSARIKDDAPTLPKRPDRPNMVESVNPAYTSSCDQSDYCGSATAGAEKAFFVALDGGGEKASNYYADIPALKAKAVAKENSYYEVGHISGVNPCRRVWQMGDDHAAKS
ncbi:protein jagged-1b-like [Patiria miniata]|uniref:Delta-like protein n=1 Tax=Patiria miniata TaxID=46514 RepID=A0A914A4G7_PATMI|nr:protein jagged-1b-like [Patiria miniata]